MRAALYLRVSTAEQTTDNQEQELRAAAACTSRGSTQPRRAAGLCSGC